MTAAKEVEPLLSLHQRSASSAFGLASNSSDPDHLIFSPPQLGFVNHSCNMHLLSTRRNSTPQFPLSKSLSLNFGLGSHKPPHTNTALRPLILVERHFGLGQGCDISPRKSQFQPVGKWLKRGSISRPRRRPHSEPFGSGGEKGLPTVREGYYGVPSSAVCCNRCGHVMTGTVAV